MVMLPTDCAVLQVPELLRARRYNDPAVVTVIEEALAVVLVPEDVVCQYHVMPVGGAVDRVTTVLLQFLVVVKVVAGVVGVTSLTVTR